MLAYCSNSKLGRLTSLVVLVAVFVVTSSTHVNHHSTYEEEFDDDDSDSRFLIRHIRQAAQQQLDCRSLLRFRTVDGSCNNLQNPLWGKSGTPYARFLPANYRDGKGDEPAARRDGSALPNARDMSVRLARDLPIENATLSHMVMMWGQFVGHDITNKPRAVARGPDRQEVKCCEVPQSQWPDNCFPVMISRFDPFYSRVNKTCMEFTRSSPFRGQGFFSNQREQTNGNTAYIDGSTVYGSTNSRAKLLRTFEFGLLKSTPQFGKHLLPKSQADCGPEDVKCFEAGDVRVNMFPALASMHTVWMREHNRIATILRQLNPHWDDERIYQETRLITGAMIQHITFKEYLPLILGPILIDWWGLNLQDRGYYTGYNPTIDPRVDNAFAVAAYRFGHSIVQGVFRRYTGEHNMLASPKLEQEFFNNSAFFSRPGEVDRIVLGLCNERPREMDAFFTDQLTNHLLDSGEGFGDDLVATSIQRGRDHGIPHYNSWREFCGLPKLKSFSDLKDMMSNEQIQALQELYGNVDDIELYPAGIAEWHVLGGIIGPTFACIVAQQFHNLRNGDRFWYENGDQPASFTQGQLNEIRQITLARILCENSDHMRTVQPEALKALSRRNPRVPCNSLRRMDFSWWKETNGVFR